MKKAKYVTWSPCVEFYRHIKGITVRGIQPSTYWVLGELLEELLVPTSSSQVKCDIF